MLYFRKTTHFIYRQWDRGIDDIDMNKILVKLHQKLEKITSTKTLVFVGEQMLKKLGLKYKNVSNLVLVLHKQNLLITMFFIKDFWQYVKSQPIKHCVLIQ